MKHLLIGLTAGLISLVAGSQVGAQESMERTLRKNAKKLITYFKDKGYKNVGVLKFLAAREGDAKLTDNVGAVNLLAARRLEMALLLANDPAAPVGIIDNASDVAAKIAGASHRSKEGREKLFTVRYPLAWGENTVQADAFITGTIVIAKDLRTLKIGLYAFDRATNKFVSLEKEKVLDDFVVANAADQLGEIGESFVLRGAFDDGKVENAQAKNQALIYQQAADVRENKIKHPGQVGDQPVILSVYYDNQNIPFEYKGGKAFIPSPREGQSVKLGLKRDNSKEIYAIALKVNGENTLDKQRLPDLGCRKWVMYPGEGPWTIAGYQIGTDKVLKFRVASVAESREREFYYGHEVGTITMTVFRELKKKPKAVLDEELPYQALIKTPPTLKARPESYGALQQQLLEEANRGIGGGTRGGGLIVDGKEEKSEVETVTFTPDPNPIMLLTVVYYTKQQK